MNALKELINIFRKRENKLSINGDTLFLPYPNLHSCDGLTNYCNIAHQANTLVPRIGLLSRVADPDQFMVGSGSGLNIKNSKSL